MSPMAMQKYVVCDLDGTLCNHDHRVYLAWLGRWDDYNLGSICDKPNLAVVDFLGNLPDYKIIFLTGRSIKYERQTIAWLTDYGHRGGRGDYVLIMREEGDFSQAAEFKRNELVAWCVKNKVQTYQIEYAIDDDEGCVQMFKELGIKKVIHYK